MRFVISKIHQKYSETAKKQKTYEHYFYEGNIISFPDEMKKEHFVIAGVDYYWKTIQDLEQDENVKQKNLDVLKYVKELF